MEYTSEISGKPLNTHNISRMKAYVADKANWFCTFTAVRGTLQNCSLSSVYKHYTSSDMPKKHDAQMDVYACATIFCHLKGVQDQSQLIDLIGKIESTETACQKPLDFWRYARRRNEKQKIQAQDYINLTGWSICLKWDGFYVRLKRESESGKWRMHTRSGNELHPPKSFLESLRSLIFPVGMEMEGELVFDSDQTCAPADRNNVENRIQKRTQDFAKLHFSSLRSTKSFTAWHRLRLVLFAFPVLGQSFRESFKNGKKLMVDSSDQHTHITACAYCKLKSTQEAFDIFTTVVQMGCEGVIVRDPGAVYENRAETDKKKSTVFKMKQKIVTDEQQKIELSGEPTRKKDGTEKAEIGYKVAAFKVHSADRPCEFTFKDWRSTAAGPTGVIEQKLKFHEKARWKMAWDLNEKGYRHTCFATDQDVSVPVPATRDDDVKSEYDREIIAKIETHLFVDTKPFQFIVETAYVFLDCSIHNNLVERGKDKIEVGMLRLTGKTDEEIQPQWFLHKEYARDHRGPIDQQLVADMTHFMHHTPYDNKRLVFVVKDKHVLENFKTYALDVMGEDRYSNLPKDTIRRLQINDKARKQQVDVILMEEWKAKKLFKTLISWNADYSAGYITEHHSNENTVCALVSPALSDHTFKTMCGKQFDACVLLQNLWNAGLRPVTAASHEIVLAYIADWVPAPRSYAGATLAPYFDQLKALNLGFEVQHKALHNTLLEYDQGKDISTGVITRSDFEKAFEAARRREKSCPHDPFEPPTHKFPYMRTGVNVWHRAWRMSEAFFRCNKMAVSQKAPAVFDRAPDLGLWLPLQQPAARAASPEDEEIEARDPPQPERSSVVAAQPRKMQRPPFKIKRILGGSDSESDSQKSPQRESKPAARAASPEVEEIEDPRLPLQPAARAASPTQHATDTGSVKSIFQRFQERRRAATDGRPEAAAKTEPHTHSPRKDSPPAALTHKKRTAEEWLDEQMKNQPGPNDPEPALDEQMKPAAQQNSTPKLPRNKRAAEAHEVMSIRRIMEEVLAERRKRESAPAARGKRTHPDEQAPSESAPAARGKNKSKLTSRLTLKALLRELKMCAA